MTDENLPSDDPDSTGHAGPFGVGPVDPLVYRQSNDTPEMRAAAAYIPAASRRLDLPQPAPVAPAPRTYSDWTPTAPKSNTPATPTHHDQDADTPVPPARRPARQVLLTAAIMTVPFLLIAAVIWFGLTLTNAQ